MDKFLSGIILCIGLFIGTLTMASIFSTDRPRDDERFNRDVRQENNDYEEN